MTEQILGAPIASSLEAVWQEPDWACPNCGFVNLPVRQKCRNNSCGRAKPVRLPLGFAELTLANRNRCGTSFHPLDDWSPADWAMAAAGELGEALNKIKKARRTDYANLATERTEIAYELADAVIYIDLLCSRLDIDLGEAVRAKFNIVSERVGSEIKL